jgi:hypothetical protein
MICLPKNIPPNLIITSGNRGRRLLGNKGLDFRYRDCFLSNETECFLAMQEDEGIAILKEDVEGEPLYIDCLED